MLANPYDGKVTPEDLRELLEGLRWNVGQTDDWEHWVDYATWTDGKVYTCLQRLEELVKEEKRI